MMHEIFLQLYFKIYFRFQGPSVWNSITEDLIKSSFLSFFKKKMRQQFNKDYWTSVHQFKIRNNTVLQCKTFSHFDILVVYVLFQLAAWHF